MAELNEIEFEEIVNHYVTEILDRMDNGRFGWDIRNKFISRVHQLLEI